MADDSASHDGGSGGAPPQKRVRKRVKPLTRKKLEKHLAAAENRGVLFFSRIPPFLKPSALRTLLSGYGTEVLRIYLAPEDAHARAGRVRSGGNKKKNYSEGWVEFEDKRRAKRIASTLNSTPIGGGHRSFYAHDLWSVKYLHKFKWAHLTEKIATEQRTKQDKLRAELQQAKKDTSFYMQKVDQAKAIDAMEQKRKAKAAAAGGGDSRKRPAPADDEGGGGEDALQQIRRRFKQRKVVPKEAADGRVPGSDVLSSLIRTKA